MTDYTELVKALRLIAKEQDCNECEAGRWHHDFECCLFEDAAAAIGGLQSKLTSLEAVLAQMPDLVETRDGWKLEPKRGKWIRHPEVKNIYGGEFIECPFCGEKYVVQYIADEKFCRNCGADMRKTEVQDG